MNPTLQYYLDSLYLCSKADEELFNLWTGFLPVRTEDMPYHSGPHSLKHFRRMVEMVKPKRVLEIGFNLGHSACMMFELGVDQICSLEISNNPKVSEAINAVSSRYGKRFRWLKGSSRELFVIHVGSPTEIDFDTIFIDGCHDREWVETDIDLGLRLGIRHFFMDDFNPHHGPGVIEAVMNKKLVPLAIFGSMAYCVPRGEFSK